MTSTLFPVDFVRRLLRVTIPGIRATYLGFRPRGKRLSNVTVSLTTYGPRMETVHAAIYSILRGNCIPEQIVLVVNENMSEAAAQSLQPFKKHGLRILQSENLGPHKKYFPVIREGLRNGSCLVTADDDIFYRRDWLQKLYEVHAAHPNDIVCWWANAMTFTGDKVDPYHAWPAVSNREARLNHFAVGAGGVLYPYSMVIALLKGGDAFLQTAPKTDDIWLHATAVESGHKVRQVKDHFEWPRHIPGTQACALKHGNHLPGGNDRAVQRTYSANAMALLRQAVR